MSNELKRIRVSLKWSESQRKYAYTFNDFIWNIDLLLSTPYLEQKYRLGLYNITQTQRNKLESYTNDTVQEIMNFFEI